MDRFLVNAYSQQLREVNEGTGTEGRYTSIITRGCSAAHERPQIMGHGYMIQFWAILFFTLPNIIVLLWIWPKSELFNLVNLQTIWWS